MNQWGKKLEFAPGSYFATLSDDSVLAVRDHASSDPPSPRDPCFREFSLLF